MAGDDLMPRLDDYLSRGVALKNMETGEPLSTIRDRVQSANVYFGAFPVAEALDRGADIVITGRVTDTGLALAPMVHEFKWKLDDWDKLSAGTIAGHTIECGAQCTGGNCQVDWDTIPNMADIGYPIIEAEPDGTFTITKHAGTGGRITVASVKEQLLYEMGDPREYITPDCVADFTTIHLEQAGPDRVRFTGIHGRPATEFYKVSISYSAGFKAIGNLVYAWPDAYKKAKASDRILRERLDHLGLKFDAIRTEFVGANACHGIPSAEPSPEIEPHLAEVVMRMGVRSQRSRGGGAIHQGTGAAGIERTAGGDRIRQRTAKSGRDSRVLAGADSQTRGYPGGYAMAKRKLIELAHARSGDKGDTSNVGIIARKPEYYPILVREVTAERVKKHFEGVCLGKVERFEIPNLGALNFLLHEASTAAERWRSKPTRRAKRIRPLCCEWRSTRDSVSRRVRRRAHHV